SVCSSDLLRKILKTVIRKQGKLYRQKLSSAVIMKLKRKYPQAVGQATIIVQRMSHHRKRMTIKVKKREKKNRKKNRIMNQNLPLFLKRFKTDYHLLSMKRQLVTDHLQ